MNNHMQMSQAEIDEFMDKVARETSHSGGPSRQNSQHQLVPNMDVDDAVDAQLVNQVLS